MRGLRLENGILEDHLHALAFCDSAAPGQRQDILALDADGAARSAHKSQDRAACRGLPASGLADQGQRLAGLQLEGHVLDRVNTAGEPAEDP